MKTAYVLGIDLGTSAIKGILKSRDGQTHKAKCAYRGETPADWLQAMAELIAELVQRAEGEIAAVGFSSQVGTYVVNDSEVISWRDSAGRQELDEVLGSIPAEEFVPEIGMYHPRLISYPLPRLLHIQRRFGADAKVQMPKEILIRALTGRTVTDIFTMRGIADPDRCRYSEALLQRLGIEIVLPQLKLPTDLAGYVTAEASQRYHIKEGTPVYLGTGDFFCGLVGMGLCRMGDGFDLSGTSEHVGYLSEAPVRAGIVSGKYFYGCCTYGVTQSSGQSCDMAIRHFGVEGLDAEQILKQKPPIFLPYLAGERAPIFDEHARGVYFGLGADCDKRQMAYAALEGVVFSLYHITQSMKAPGVKRMICGGGSAANALMNRLRATLFNCETVCVQENDTSALGACMLAMVGAGWYKDIREAIGDCVAYKEPVQPMPQLRDILLKRFEIYRDLYGDLKERFRAFGDL